MSNNRPHLYNSIQVIFVKWKYERKEEGFDADFKCLDDALAPRFPCTFTHTVELTPTDLGDAGDEGILELKLLLQSTQYQKVGLRLVIYSGHAEARENKLFLVNEKAKGQHKGIDFQETFGQVALGHRVLRPFVDLLLVLDCCDGGTACNQLQYSNIVNGRTYVMAATKKSGIAPFYPNSFAAKLSYELSRVSAAGVTINELYQRMKARVPETQLMRPVPENFANRPQRFPTAEFILYPSRVVNPSDCYAARGFHNIDDEDI